MQRSLRILGWLLIVSALSGSALGLWRLGMVAHDQALVRIHDQLMDLAESPDSTARDILLDLAYDEQSVEMGRSWRLPDVAWLCLWAEGLMLGVAVGVVLLALAQGLDALER